MTQMLAVYFTVRILFTQHIIFDDYWIHLIVHVNSRNCSFIKIRREDQAGKNLSR